jgi:hypothetical protein
MSLQPLRQLNPTGFWIGLLSTSLVVGSLLTAAETSPVTPVIPPTDEQFLSELEERTFKFFWDTANPKNGLVPDRWPTPSPSSVAAVGFGLTTYCVGVERGYITRDQAVDRVLATLRFLWQAPHSEDADATGYRGFFYHFIDMQSGKRSWNCELSSIDTALFMAGVLACREYFHRDEPREQEIRELADALYRRVEWTWMQPRPPLVCMSWKPEGGFGQHEYHGYNEAMVLYVLALGSPSHAIDASAWEAYTKTYHWAEFYGQELLDFEPLFGHQYSHIWIDFRKIQDPYMRGKGIDYFENSRRATLAQRAYAMANPSRWRGYGADVWGLTACDGPVDKALPYDGEERQFHSYFARGAGAQRIIDDGTIAPTAAGGSVAFAPEIVIPALKRMREKYGEHLFLEYGFRDSFNPSFNYRDVDLKMGQVVEDAGWFAGDYLGIDQGPIVLMVENHRSGLVWDVMKQSSYVRRGLQRAGFSGGWLDEQP